jgi:hypothetical protein
MYLPEITAAQCRMARAALGWSRMALAQKASLPHGIVMDFENGRDLSAALKEKLCSALMSHGVQFIDHGGAGRGVTVPHVGEHVRKPSAVTGITPILNEIERCLAADLYFPAVAIALTLPDVCGSLETPSGTRGVRYGARYIAWYDSNVGSRFPALSGPECWSLRCGVSHSAALQEGGKEHTRIGFALPHPSAMMFVGCVFGGMLVTDATAFCQVMMESARHWFAANGSEPVVLANLDRLFAYRPEGVAPHVVGVPLIA